MITILVPDEETKADLIEESEYLHYHLDLDSDRCGNLMHIYNNPDCIKVGTVATKIEEFLEMVRCNREIIRQHAHDKLRRKR